MRHGETNSLTNFRRGCGQRSGPFTTFTPSACLLWPRRDSSYFLCASIICCRINTDADVIFDGRPTLSAAKGGQMYFSVYSVPPWSTVFSFIINFYGYRFGDTLRRNPKI